MGRKIDLDKFKKHMTNLMNKSQENHEFEYAFAIQQTILIVEQYAQTFSEGEE